MTLVPARIHSMLMLSLVLGMLADMELVMAQGSQQPNLLVILADDLGYGELGMQGNHQIPTPHIDSIATEGVRLTQAYVTAPNCSPSRAGLLTGRIPTRFGYEFNPVGARNEDPSIGLPSQEITLAEWLHDRGYTTGLIGKWHLGGAAAYHPMRHGYDEFFGFTHEGHSFVPFPWQGVTTMLRRKVLPGGGQGRWISPQLIYTTHMGHDEPDYDANNPIVRGGQPVDERAHLSDAFAREAVDFMTRHADKPFYLQLSFNAVHSPLQGAQEHLSALNHIQDVHRRIFASMVTHLDQAVGRVLQAVKDLELTHNTLVVFLSDNGGPTRELTSSNLPLRGEKGQLYEGGIRVPMSMMWPGVLPSAKVYDGMVVSVDLFATMAARVGKIPESIDGVDLLPYLTGNSQDPPHRIFFWRQGRKTALRLDHWKLINMKGSLANPSWELYDLQSDPAELEDLSTMHPGQLKTMTELWQQWQLEMKSPIF